MTATASAHPKSLLTNQNGLRVGHIVCLEQFEFGCHRGDAQPGTPVFVGLSNVHDLPDGFNGYHEPARGFAPFLVTEVTSLEEDSEPLDGFVLQYLPGLKLVKAVRLSPAPELQQVSFAERIIFVIGEYAATDQNLPLVQSVDRIGRREKGITTLV